METLKDKKIAKLDKAAIRELIYRAHLAGQGVDDGYPLDLAGKYADNVVLSLSEQPDTAPTVDELQTIEVCEQGEIVVMAKDGKNIIDVGRECIALANYLKLCVKLHFNDRVIRVFRNTDIGKIINSK